MPRFFLLMSSNHQLLRACYAGKKTWLAGVNVLGVTEIEPDSAEALIPALMNIAQGKNIKLDTICLFD